MYPGLEDVMAQHSSHLHAALRLWAEDELLRRGWSLQTWVCNQEHKEDEWPDAVVWLKYPEHKIVPLVTAVQLRNGFIGPTLLDCLLDAIKATEPKP